MAVPKNTIASNRADSADECKKTCLSILPPQFYIAFFSKLAKNRKPSPIRSLMHLEGHPGVLSLLQGKPNSSTFPLTSLQFTARSPTNSNEEISLSIRGAALEEGLQYCPTAGVPSLLNWMYGLMQREHKRVQGEGWRTTVASGSQDAISKVLAALLDPGDALLIEKPVYAGILPVFQSLQCDMIGIDVDSCGLSSKCLRSVLENWPSTKPRPKALYTVPYGSNPSGMTTKLERRLEVLELAKQYNFIILEDDPYYFLYYGDATRTPSYFALEAQTGEVGRVVRFDSFSKVLSAGIRIGFASGPTSIIDAVDMDTSCSSLQSASLTQVIASTLLHGWGYDGFRIHTEQVANFYRQKRDVFEMAMQKHLSDLAEWTTPEAGMFFWFKLLLDEGTCQQGDSEALVRTKALDGGVLALPGTVFYPNGDKTSYVRAAFSLLSAEEVDEALFRLRKVILGARGELRDA